jgi:hypothetical protein
MNPLFSAWTALQIARGATGSSKALGNGTSPFRRLRYEA